MITQKLPPPCLSQVFGKFVRSCTCRWCQARLTAEYLAAPDVVTQPYDPDLTVVLRVERER